MSKPNTIQDVLLKLVICEPTTLDTGCWEWPGAKNTNGYGQVRLAGRTRLVHRLIYEHFVGSMPKGLEPHHECENPACSNFEHLVLLTRKEHRRHHPQKFFPRSLKRTCPKGHEFTEENTWFDNRGSRVCKKCRGESNRAWRKRKSAENPPPPHYNTLKTICPLGHPYDEENTRVAFGRRYCRACSRERDGKDKPAN